MPFRAALLALSLTTAPVFAAQPAPLTNLVKSVDIPFEQFTLANGLRVIVHTDRKAPVVGVTVYYHIGSKHEPVGKTGFAHLFEHLMFAGSANVPQFDNAVIALGGANNNGSTFYDRTNYVETVPTAALERMLFIEADRMGDLLPAVTQERLNNQRGVVQNEKRQGDNQPFGLDDYYVSNALYPAGHPYRHDTIGSMADLDVASLATVKGWFRDNYGPANAVLVLAGDVDVATARPLVEKYFGAIPAGRAIALPAAPVATLPAPRTIALHDRVPYTRVARYWSVEGINGRDTTALDAAAGILGGLSSSRFDNALVRGDATAVSVSAYNQSFEQVGVMNVEANVKPGADAAKVAARLDAIVAQFLRDGPTADELQRYVARTIASQIEGYESVGGFSGKAATLAEGLLYSNDPAYYRRELDELAALTPVQVRDAARRWMGRPALSLIVTPGPRDESAAARAITGDVAGEVNSGSGAADTPPPPTRELPALGSFTGLDFPAIERGKLSNGIPVYFARRGDLPLVRVAISFDAGAAADAPGKLGLQSLTMSLLDEGTTTRNSQAIAEAQERLGATLSSSGGMDRSTVYLTVPTTNLSPALDLLTDVVRNPAFAPREVERLRSEQLARIQAQLSQPMGIANTVLPSKLFGAGHPYAQPTSGLGTAATVSALTPGDVAAFKQAWLRPEKAAIFVAGDTTLAAIQPMLEARFGVWPGNRMALPQKSFGIAPVARAGNTIYLVDRPQSPQSVIAAGQVLRQTGKDPALYILSQANQVLGGPLVSRLDLDLRETRGWSYGVRARLDGVEDRIPLVITAPVQADRTGDSVAAVLEDVRVYLTAKGTTDNELRRSIDGTIRELPAQFEGSDDVLAAMQRIVMFGRPDDYYQTLGARLQTLTAADLDQAARASIDPAAFAIVVVGDAKVIRPQLDKLGLPVETVVLPAAK